MISIVIPAWNEEKLLPECLESLRNQDYKESYEIIVADNGSTDKTAEIARQYGALVIPCPEIQSVFYARQVGAEAAHGDIIAQADADTIYPGNWLSTIHRQLSEHSEAVAVTGRFVYSRNSPFWAVVEYFLRYIVNMFCVAFAIHPIVISGATFAFRRNVFMAMNGYHGLTYAADQYGIAARLSKMGRIIYDSKLCVATSPRSVNKPVTTIIMDFLAHVTRWTVIVSYNRFSAIARSVSLPNSRRIAFRLSLLAIFLVSFLAYGYYSPTSQVFGKVYYQGNHTHNAIALTFDDGPNEPYTSQILDELYQYHVKATFFVVGKNVETYPETARRIVDEGHVIANHSYSHNANHALTEYGSRDMLRAQTVIEDTVGVIPELYRPPHGKFTPWELWSVKKDKMLPMTWSVSAGELSGLSAPELAQHIVSKTRSGSIILLHDGYGTQHGSGRADKTVTVQAVPLIIAQLQAKGFNFVTVPELLNVPEYGGSASR